MSGAQTVFVPMRGRVTRPWPGVVFDACVTLAALLGSLLRLAHPSDGMGLDAASGFLAAAASLPLLVWRRNPIGVLALTTIASATSMALGYPPGPPLGPTAALFLVAASRDEAHRWTLRTTATVIGLFILHYAGYAIGQDKPPGTTLIIGSLVWAVAWFAGDRTRLRGAEIAELERRAARGRADAERDRRLAAAEERARIARDLHDSAAHAINVIAVQAGAARLLQQRDPARSRAALETIEMVARQTVGEIDQIVRSLRAGEATNGHVEAPAGIGALDALIARHAATGLAVTVETTGRPRSLAPATDQAVYRILQEALTNAARHGAGPAAVELAFEAGSVSVVVTNAVGRQSGNDTDRAGHGLVGMRERAALVGGTCAVQRNGGTFMVRARVPERSAGA